MLRKVCTSRLLSENYVANFRICKLYGRTIIENNTARKLYVFNLFSEAYQIEVNQIEKSIVYSWCYVVTVRKKNFRS